MLVHEVTCPNELNSRQIHHQVTHLHLNYCLSVFRVARPPADDGFSHGIYPFFEGVASFLTSIGAKEANLHVDLSEIGGQNVNQGKICEPGKDNPGQGCPSSLKLRLRQTFP